MAITIFQKKILCIFFVLLVLFVYKTSNSNSESIGKIQKDLGLINAKQENQNHVDRVVEISKILQKTAQKMGKLSCQLANKNLEVSLNGGWCSNESGATSKQHVTDEKLVQYLSKFLKGFLIFKN